MPDEQEIFNLFEKRLDRIYLVQKILHMSLSIEDQVALKIVNKLYQYEMKTKFRIKAVNPMLLKYLK